MHTSSDYPNAVFIRNHDDDNDDYDIRDKSITQTTSLDSRTEFVNKISLLASRAVVKELYKNLGHAAITLIKYSSMWCP